MKFIFKVYSAETTRNSGLLYTSEQIYESRDKCIAEAKDTAETINKLTDRPCIYKIEELGD